MAVETKWDLNDKTVEKLQTLIRYNLDSYDGFRECAEEVNDRRLAQLFRELAEERMQNAEVLQTHVEWNGEDAREEGGMAAAVHRAWINIRSNVNSDNAYAVLAEAERGEDYIKDAYEDVLKETSGSAMSDVLHQQYRGVKAGHDRIRDLRDSCKEE
ncbi:PA2169 family four-helix-bundle protein [Thalassoglobus sp. JC818]|uniref:PA2169 family four-helix-bundle protein n=1 Tax=Thalassoglobus sp. JC818 TaxID=3232136 RepID=UPI00345AA072